MGWPRCPFADHYARARRPLTVITENAGRRLQQTFVGDKKDGEARQRKAIEGYAKAAGIEVVDWLPGSNHQQSSPTEISRTARCVRGGYVTSSIEATAEAE
jgi:hypothetical protein